MARPASESLSSGSTERISRQVEVTFSEKMGSGVTTPANYTISGTGKGTLAANPEPYIGEWVTVTAAVEQSLAPLAFSMDQDKTKSTGKEVLVLAPRMNSPIEVNTYVTVIGQVVRFDPEEIAKASKDYKVDLPADVIAKYKGQPTVLATAIVNSAGLDVAKRPLPPVTADDELLTKIMKQVGPAKLVVVTL